MRKRIEICTCDRCGGEIKQTPLTVSGKGPDDDNDSKDGPTFRVDGTMLDKDEVVEFGDLCQKCKDRLHSLAIEMSKGKGRGRTAKPKEKVDIDTNTTGTVTDMTGMSVA